jgi:hypothetical protein
MTGEQRNTVTLESNKVRAVKKLIDRGNRNLKLASGSGALLPKAIDESGSLERFREPLLDTGEETFLLLFGLTYSE